MKAKSLIPLVIVLAILAGLVAFRQWQIEPPSIVDQVELVPLTPPEVDAGDIARIEIYAGANPEENVVLVKHADDEWRVASHYGAPAKETDIQTFLDTLADLKGEFRETVDSDDDLKAYQLDESEGFHVKGFSEAGEDPLFHVISGKAPDFGSALMRAADAQDVYFVNKDLRRETGLYTTERSDPPEADHWLDKEVLALEQDTITKLALTYPDKAIAFELQEKPAEATEEAQTPDDEGDGEPTDVAGDAGGPAPPVQEWVVTSGGIGESLNQTGVQNIITKLTSLRATGVVDPAKKDDWALTDPAYRAVITTGVEDVVLEGSHPEVDGNAYLRVASNERDIVYEVSKFNFEQVFPNGSEFFELPGILADAVSLESIEYSVPGAHVRLARDDDGWRIVEPVVEMETDSARLDRLARTAASLKAVDYADTAEGKALDTPARELTIVGPDIKHTILAGDTSPHNDGFYARIDSFDSVLVLGESDATDVFAKPAQLYMRDLFPDLLEDDITKLEISKGDETLSLERGDVGWTILTGEGPAGADEAIVDDVLLGLTLLEADDFILGDAFTLGGVLGSIGFTTADGAEHRLTIYEGDEDAHPVEVAGKSVQFRVANRHIERVFRDPADLRVRSESPEEPEPVADPSSDPAVVTDEAAPDAEGEGQP